MRRDLEELKKQRAKLDERVYVYIKNHAPQTRDEQIKVSVPEVLFEQAAHSDEERKLRAIRSCTERLEAAGRIQRVEAGTPHWEIVEA